jgi:uncharacterized protein YlxW (UPF0749 family)
MACIESASLGTRSPAQGSQWRVRLLAPGLVCFLLGVMLVVQLRTRRELDRTSSPAGSSSLGMLSALVEANARLRQERAALNDQIAEYQTALGQERLTVLVEELRRLRIANGLVETRGPGIQISLEDLLSPVEMQDLVNELRNSGAEAIALNGHRLIASSVVAASRETLIVDGQLLEPPYVFEAIGSPDDMETAMARQGGLLALLAQAHDRQGYEVIQQDHIVLPVHTRPPRFDYARPVE